MCCDACRRTLDDDTPTFTIPLDETLRRTSGIFCSPQCALFANYNINTDSRLVFGYEQREQWFYQLYQGRLEEKLKK